MLKRKILGATLGLAFLSFSPLASAQCVEDPREVRLDQDNVVRLKSYLCRVGQDQNDPQIKVEFHRFAELSASLLIAKSSSAMLRKTIGSPKAVENDVFKAYADLLQKYGTNYDLKEFLGSEAEVSFSVNASGVSDKIEARTLRAINNIFGNGSAIEYPAVTEISAMKGKTIPQDISYFYSVACAEDSCPLDDFVMNFWRGLRHSDLASYPKNVRDYNRIVASTDYQLQVDEPGVLKLVRGMAGEQWPEDFLLIIGNEGAEQCGEGDPPGIQGRMFRFWARNIKMDAVTIENVSNRAVKIASILEDRSVDTRLHPVSDPSGSNNAAELDMTLAPGEKLLYPTRLIFVSNDKTHNDFFPMKSSDEVYRKVDANGYRGNVGGYGFPVQKDYAFGPEIAVRGVVVDGKPVDLTKAGNENAMDLTASAMAGSCPYLVSWDGKDWIEHGKVLHKGQGKVREYSETKKFEGFRARFRLEEREPEIAHIDHAELVALLKNGSTLTLKSDNKKLAARDGDYLELMWGEGIELAFSLPEGVAEEDVAESRFTLTGYYERYSNLLVSTPKASSVVEEGGRNP